MTLSEFFKLSVEEKSEIYQQVMKRACESQLKVIEEAKQIKENEFDQNTDD